MFHDSKAKRFPGHRPLIALEEITTAKLMARIRRAGWHCIKLWMDVETGEVEEVIQAKVYRSHKLYEKVMVEWMRI